MLIFISVLLSLIFLILTALLLVIVNYLRVMNDTIWKSFNILSAIATNVVRINRQ